MPAAASPRLFAEKLTGLLAHDGPSLRVTLPEGQEVEVGSGTPTATVAVRTKSAARHLLSFDEEGIAESYLAGEIDIDGTFRDIFKCREALQRRRGAAWLLRFLVPWLIGQRRTNRAAIQRHYDLPPDFYLSFLDPTWPAYSQGLYTKPSEPLSTALERKYDFVEKACHVTKGCEALEVGPGWGAFVKYMLPRDVRLTALTNSSQSRSYLEAQYPSPSLRMQDGDFLSYRPGRRFDLVTIMGVLEHLPNYRRVCSQLRKLLRPGGYAYVDASASRRKYQMSRFIYKHIFPYNHSFLHLRSFLAAAKEQRLEVVSVDDDSLSYRYTIETWARNLEAARERLVSKFGQYDFRRFRLYLWGSAHAFARDELQCYRVVLRAP